MTEHSRLLAPSAAHRWMNCSGSALASAHYQDVPGEAAMEGTAAHWLLEECLTKGENPRNFIGRTITVTEKQVTRDFVVDREMADDVLIGDNAVREMIKVKGVSRVEFDVRLNYIDAHLFGRTDVWHLANDGVFSLLDYKHGRTDVDPFQNEQEMIYALGVLRKVYPYIVPTKIRLGIAQPRSLAPVPRVKWWETSFEVLLQFEDRLRVAVRYVKHETPEFTVGKWCKHCPALGACPATQDMIVKLAPVLLMHDLSPGDAAKVLALKDLLEKKIEDAQAVAKDALLRGIPVPGKVLVTGRKHRQWRDADMAKDRLLEALGPGVLREPTPAQAEKLGDVAKRIVEDLAFTPPGSPEIADVGDKRAPYVARSAEQMFPVT